MEQGLKPKLISVLKEGYPPGQFKHDLIAGITVGILSFAMALAFAIGSGARPEQGLYTAIIAGFLTSLLSGSRVQIGGPTGTFIVLLAYLMQHYGYEGLAIITIIAGILLIILGILRLGSIIKFIPYPVIAGFTSGIAVVIFSSQIPDFFGLQMTKIPAEFIAKWSSYIQCIGTINFYTLGLGLFAIIIVLVWPHVSKKIPGSLVAIIITAAIARIFQLPITTIGSRFGEIPNHLPMPHLPSYDLWQIPHLIVPAVSVALLIAIESLLSAIVADGMLGRRHRSNMELVALGIANISSILFHGIPSTGTAARTATNIKSGGRTPLAGMISAFTVLLIMLFVGKWTALIPMTTLAAILIVVAYNLSEWRQFSTLFSGPKSDIIVLLTSFLLTIFTTITTALEVSIVLAAFLFVYQMADTTKIKSLKESLQEEDDPNDPLHKILRTIPQDIEIFEIQGPFFFAATEKFTLALKRISRYPKVLILHMYQVPNIDASGLHVLVDILNKTRVNKTQLLISGVSPQVIKILKKSGFIEHIGTQNIFKNLSTALNYGKELLEKPNISFPNQ